MLAQPQKTLVGRAPGGIDPVFKGMYERAWGGVSCVAIQHCGVRSRRVRRYSGVEIHADATKTPCDIRSPTVFATVGRGKATLSTGERKNIFSQGDAADAVFSIQEGKVKLTSLR